MLRINVPTLKTLDPKYESKLIDKAVMQYLSTKRYVIKKKSETHAKQLQYGTSSQDLFLPTARRQTSSGLLRNESYLEISDDESGPELPSDSEGESSSQSSDIE